MAKVKCKACGARYDYHEHGCCPECGAYNRPPQRNRVGADGVVHRMSDADFLEDRAKRSRSQSGKVCFEREECYEEQARYSSRSPFDAVSSRPEKKKESSPGDRRRKLLITMIAVILLVNVIPILLTMCSVSGVFEEIVDELFSTEVGWDEPVEVPVPIAPARPVPDLSGAQVITFGQSFQWGDSVATVTTVTANEMPDLTTVDITVRIEDPLNKPTVCYSLPDGAWVEAECGEATHIGKQEYVYCFELPDRQPGSAYCALFGGQTDGVWQMYELPLN